MKMKIWMIVLLTAVFVLPPAAQNAFAQDGKDKTKKTDASKQKKQSFTLKATKVESGRGGEDPNIKDRSMANTENQDFVAPKEKGGTTTGRGAAGVCRVDFDNRTNLKVQLFVDGAFRGVLAPYGDASVYTGSGPTRVYARAEFTDGSYVYWGPSDYTCYSGQYIDFRMDR